MVCYESGNRAEMNQKLTFKLYLPDWVVAFRWLFLLEPLKRIRKSGVEVVWLDERAPLPFDLYVHELYYYWRC